MDRRDDCRTWSESPQKWHWVTTLRCIAILLPIALPALTAPTFAHVQLPTDEPVLVVTLKGHAAGIGTVAFSRDKKMLASASADRTVKVWDVQTGEARLTLHVSSRKYTVALGLSPDGKIVAVGNQDADCLEVKVWDVTTGREMMALPHGPGVSTVLFSPDGKTLATEEQAGPARLWDTETWQVRATLHGYAGSDGSGLAFSPDGKMMATASMHEDMFPKLVPKLWETATGKLVASFQGEDSRPACVAFSPDGKWLAVGEWRPRVRLYDVPARKEVQILEHWCMISKVSFQPDGMLTVLSGIGRHQNDPQEAQLWISSSGKLLRTFKPRPDHVGRRSFGAQALSLDGKLWATGCADNTIKLWRVSEAEPTVSGVHPKVEAREKSKNVRD